MASRGTESGITPLSMLLLSGELQSKGERASETALSFPSCSVISKRCQNLLLQIYLHFPEVIQHVTLPEGTFSSGGAAYSNSCKVARCL